MKMNVDEAIEILTEHVALDRRSRNNETESDFDKFCESKNIGIESLIEYVFASGCAFKPSNKELRDNMLNTLTKEIEDLQGYAKNDDMYYHGLIAGIYFSEKIINDLWK